MKGAQVHGGMMDLYEGAKHHREEIISGVELSRLVKRLRAARKRCADMSRASILMWELERDASRPLKLLRGPKIPPLATCSPVRREP